MTIIDWLSFTIVRVKNTNNKYNDMVHAFLLSNAELIKHLGVFGWERGKGRKSYSSSFYQDRGIAAYIGKDHILIEISGKGCQALGHLVLRDIIEPIVSNVTRIDIARDFDAYLTPDDVVNNITENRMRSRSHITSETGTTIYLGSPKSEHYLRVYSYNAPHPRAGLLRVEYVARRKHAKQIALRVIEDGLAPVYAHVVDRFGLPESVGINAIASEVRVELGDRSDSKTLLWLIKTCVPAIKRLVREGVIDLDEFIEEYLQQQPPNVL